MKNVVVIPAYNESKRIGRVLDEVKKYCDNIIVVDDGSQDNTYQVVEQKRVTLISHPLNLGKGAALKTGCDYAIHNEFENIIVMDSDGQHDPKKIPEFFLALTKNPLVFGIREENREEMPLFKKFGNNVLDLAFRTLYHTTFSDTQSGYRAFTKETYTKVRWDANDYSMESEMIARADKHAIAYSTLSIPTIYLDRYKGTGISDGLKILINLIKWKVSL